MRTITNPLSSSN